MCLSTDKPRQCFCGSKMNACEVEGTNNGVSNSRTFDENRCDSTALLERELKLTAEKCSVMAQKLTKSGSVQKHRKCQCEHQKALETERLVADLEHKISALQTENTRLQKIPKSKLHNDALYDHQAEVPETRTSELEHKISALRAENLKLRQLLKDVTEVNKRWQKYNRETQAYIQRLEESIRNQSHKEFDLSTLSLDDETNRRDARLFPGSRHSDSQLEQGTGQTALRFRYENAVKEVCKLQKQMEESQQIQAAFTQQMELLRKEKTDQLMLLELQTKAYKEDWEAEKKEKLTAQEKVSRLTEEMRELKIELADCKKRLKQIQATSSSNQSEDIWNKVKPTMPFHSRLTGIRSWANALTERSPYQANNIGILVADTADEMHKSHSAPTSWENVKVDDVESSSLTDDDNNELECPGCKKTFPRRLHLQFLDHFEECQAPHVES